MSGWTHVLVAVVAVAGAGGAVVLLQLLLLWFWCCERLNERKHAWTDGWMEGNKMKWESKE